MLAHDTTPLPRRWPWRSTLVITAVTALAGAGGLFVASKHIVDHVERVPGVAEVLSPESDTFDNYLLVGSDSRDAGDPNTGDSASSSGRRSDTIMVLRVDRSDGSAALLSIPRDLYVTVYGHTEPSRINAAFSENPAVLVQTVQTALGVPVHHYVEVDFVGFKDLVDALGGIELCFERPTRDTNTGLNITKPGCQVLDGVQALAYARSRHYEELIDETWHEDPRSDFGRTARQRDFVNRCLQSALAQVQQQPYRSGELAAAIVAAIRIDEELDPVSAAGSLRQAVGGGLASYTVPVADAEVEGNAVLVMIDSSGPVMAWFRGEGPRPT